MPAPTAAAPSFALWAAGGGVLVLLLLSSVLSAIESTFRAASRSRLHILAERGDLRAGRALALLEHRERLCAALLLGSILSGVIAVVLATWLLVVLLGLWGLLAAGALMTIALFLVAVLLPQGFAASGPETAAARAAGPAALVLALLGPPADLGRGVARRLAPRPAPDPAEDAPGGADPDPEGKERDRRLEGLDLGDREVEEVMMHRRDIEMIDAEAAPAEIFAQAINSPHTRIPIFRGEPENIVGVIHAKDLSRAVHRFVREHDGGERVLEGFDVMDVAMPPYFIPESTTLDDQLREFLRRRSHFALVVDEYGALQGLVTLEDIIEEIVGDISDEHDVEEPDGIERQPDGSVVVDGSVPIRDLNRALDWDLADEEANTIAGLVIHVAQSIPNPGQSFEFGGFRFEVVEREHNRLTRLHVQPLA
jgi:Mg2+/Co2+ transporter CorB